MPVERYYLSESAYAYPSSNANDGGDDNTEYNLKTITDKIAIKSFVVRRKGKYQNYFLPSYSDQPVGVKISGGECSINGYYFDLDEIVVETNDSQSKTILSPLTKYNIVLRIYKDGNDNLRGDGTALVGPNVGKLECRGIVASLMTDDEYETVDKNSLLLLGYTETDDSGHLPEESGSYSQDPSRFSFIDSNTVLTDSGQRIEDWVEELLNFSLSRLSQLNYYSHESDESPKSTLMITEDNKLIYQTNDSPKTISFDIVDINDRTHVSEKDKYTESKFNESLTIIPEDSNTWNGESDLICRSDHNHDRRYILRTCSDSNVTQIIETSLKVNRELISNKISVTTNGGREVSSFNDDGSAKIGNIDIDTESSITGIKNLTASGDIRAGRVFNAVWNDYADAVTKSKDTKVEPGDLICKVPGKNEYTLSTYENRKRVVGVCSDTFGHLLGGEGKSIEEILKKSIPIAVAGNVMAKVVGKASAGDLIVPSALPGVGMKADGYCCGTVVGKILDDKLTDEVERVLIQVSIC